MELVVISGKGGTGKTTVAASLAALEKNVTTSDCDVDAANMYLYYKEGKITDSEDFFGENKAYIDPEKCTQCGLCEEKCRFGAISNCRVEEMLCEGCGVCAFICPSGAVEFGPRKTADILTCSVENGIHVFADMRTGADGSGKLVTDIRKKAREIAGDGLLITDGSPGIGCQVIASLTGAEKVLIVSEPTLSGLADFKRVNELCKSFGMKPAVCINKYDINREMSDRISAYAADQDLFVAGMIPFDETVVKSVNELKPLVTYEDSPAAAEIIKMRRKLFRKGDAKVKIAVAADKEGMISAHFGHCDYFIVYTVLKNEIAGRENVPNPGHEPGFLPEFLHEKEVEAIIAGGMGRKAGELFAGKKIEALCVEKKNPDEAVKAWLAGELESTGEMCDH